MYSQRRCCFLDGLFLIKTCTVTLSYLHSMKMATTWGWQSVTHHRSPNNIQRALHYVQNGTPSIVRPLKTVNALFYAERLWFTKTYLTWECIFPYGNRQYIQTFWRREKLVHCGKFCFAAYSAYIHCWLVSTFPVLDSAVEKCHDAYAWVSRSVRTLWSC